MYKYILQSIEGLNWFGIVPLVLFFLFFLGIFLRTILKNKDAYGKLENLPLED